MQNENLTEKDIRAIGVAAWDAIKGKGKAEAESELIGSVILGIYPVNSCRMTENGIETYQAGMAILYRKENDNEVKTAIIETSSAQDSPEDAITLSFHDTIIYPEETAH